MTRFLNLDFEVSNYTGTPKGWFIGGNGYETRVDTAVAYSGQNSLRIQRKKPGEFGFATQTFPIELYNRA